MQFSVRKFIRNYALCFSFFFSSFFFLRKYFCYRHNLCQAPHFLSVIIARHASFHITLRGLSLPQECIEILQLFSWRISSFSFNSLSECWLPRVSCMHHASTINIQHPTIELTYYMRAKQPKWFEKSEIKFKKKKMFLKIFQLSLCCRSMKWSANAYGWKRSIKYVQNEILSIWMDMCFVFMLVFPSFPHMVLYYCGCRFYCELYIFINDEFIGRPVTFHSFAIENIIRKKKNCNEIDKRTL